MLAVAPAPVDTTPPVIRIQAPARIAPARFVDVRVGDDGGGLSDATVDVNGTSIDAKDLAAKGSERFRATAGWEPGRRYEIRITATDAAGNVSRLERAFRPRNFGIVELAVRDLTRARRVTASAAGCGYVHLRPRHFPLGSTPLALGDSVMLGAAWRLTRVGFETDTLCARKPRDGLGVLRARRRDGTLPQTVVVALGTNVGLTDGDVAAMLRVLGPQRRLMLVTPLRDWRPFGDGPMRRAAQRDPDRVGLIDWSGLGTRHPEWFWSDGTHLRPVGLPGYRDLIHGAVWATLGDEYTVLPTPGHHRRRSSRRTARRVTRPVGLR